MKTITTIIFLLGMYNNMQSQTGLTSKHFSSFILKQDVPENTTRTHLMERRSLKEALLHPELFSSLAGSTKMPLVFCAKTLPFFCKIEHQVEKRGGFPIKFRLGEVQQVEAKEGKR